MALINYATREINAKIVYYGPGLSGKTTNIQHVFSKVKQKNKGKLIALSTQGDRTLFFDFLPVELGEIKGFKTRFHLYTVPGQVFYNSTRKLVLKGADGVVFVADSQKMMMDENIQSFENLRANLAEMGVRADDFPIVVQYNKRDLPNAASVAEMEEYLNPAGLPYFEASAIKGEGVLPTLTSLVKHILYNLKQDPEGQLVELEKLQEERPAEEPAREEEGMAITVRSAAPDVSITGVNIRPAASDISLPEIEMIKPSEPPAPAETFVEEAVEPEAAEPEAAEVEAPLAELSLAEPEYPAVPEPEDLAPLPFLEPPAVSEAPVVAELHGEPEPIHAEPTPMPAPPEELAAAPVPRSSTSFILPVRLTSPDGVREVSLKVNVEIELAGEAGLVRSVEALQPAPRPPIGIRQKPPDLDRPKAPVPAPKPAAQPKKRGMFQKILGMKII